MSCMLIICDTSVSEIKFYIFPFATRKTKKKKKKNLVTILQLQQDNNNYLNKKLRKKKIRCTKKTLLYLRHLKQIKILNRD